MKTDAQNAPFLYRCDDSYPGASVTTQEQFLSKRQRYQPIGGMATIHKKFGHFVMTPE